MNEERFPDGWQTKCKARKGMTNISWNVMVNTVEFGIKERRKVDLEGIEVPNSNTPLSKKKFPRPEKNPLNIRIENVKKWSISRFS